MPRLTYRLFLSTCALVLTLGFFPVPSRAAEQTSISPPVLGVQIPGLNLATIQTGQGPVAIPWLAQYISAVYKYLMGASVIVAIIMVMYGGFRYLMGSAIGDAKAGKEIIKDAIMGLIVLMCAYVLLQTINPRLVKLQAITAAGSLEDDSVTYPDRDVEKQGGGGGGGGGTPAYTGTPQKVDPTLEGIFKAYAACYGFDWHVLKAIATIESSLNPRNQRPSGKYKGLFQFDVESCQRLIRKYPASLNLDCNDLFDPETNTAAAAARFNEAFGKIERNCNSQNITSEETIRLLYVGHNNGPDVLGYVLQSGVCKLADQANKVADYSRETRHADYAKLVPPEDGIAKWAYGAKAVDILRQDGVTSLFPANGLNDDICPLMTGIRAIPQK